MSLWHARLRYCSTGEDPGSIGIFQPHGMPWALDRPNGCVVWVNGRAAGNFGIVVGGTAAGLWDFALALDIVWVWESA